MIVQLMNKLRAKKRAQADKHIEKVSVLIQAATGEQFLVAQNYFVDRDGHDRSIVKKFGTVQAAASRVMRMLRIDTHQADYEIVRVPNLGPRRNHFVVWFPNAAEFDAQHFEHDFEIARVDDLLFKRVTKVRTLQYICAKAADMHASRQAVLVE